MQDPNFVPLNTGRQTPQQFRPSILARVCRWRKKVRPTSVVDGWMFVALTENGHRKARAMVPGMLHRTAKNLLQGGS
jgi:hypothetical protein